MQRMNRVVLMLAGLALGGCVIPPQSGQPAGGGAAPYGGGSPGGDPAQGGGGEGAAAGPGPGAGPAAPAPPQIVSVTIRSACPRTVKVFYGDKPKFGSGTYSTISSNSVQSHTFRPGESIWIVDDSENGVAQYTAQPGASTIEIASSCTSIH